MRRIRHALVSGAVAIILSTGLISRPAFTAGQAGDFGRHWPRTDFSRATVALEEIGHGGLPRDAIPAIDHPRFEAAGAAADWLYPREPIVALEIGGDARAYPIQILMWHEIVNDTVGGRPVAVTFCPLCNAALAFERRVDGRLLDFGTTGKLRHSDLVMYDRQTESWWQQFTGTGIVGHFAGRSLTRVPATIIAFEDFRKTHPDGRVLSRDTGHTRDYGRNPYRGYDRVGDRPFLLRGKPDPRLPAMQRVLGLSVAGLAVAYPLPGLVQRTPLNDDIGGTPVAVFAKGGTHSALDREQITASRVVPSAAAYDRRLEGRRLTFERDNEGIVDRETGSRWNLLGHAVDGPLLGRRLTPLDSGVYFAFAWLAFQPGSEIRSGDAPR
jgi:hypothetical protein